MNASNLEPPPEMIPRPRRRSRWLLRVGFLLLIVTTALALLYGYFAYITDRDVREAMAEAGRDAPNGWQLADLDAQRAEVPDEENAALVAMAVQKLLPRNWPIAPSPLAPVVGEEAEVGFGPPLPWHEKFHELPPEVQLDAALLRDLQASLEAAGPARAEARKLIGMTRGRFPLTWAENVFDTLLQSQDARNAANLLRYEAALQCQEGHADAALDCVRGLIGAARSIGDEPLLISALIRLACDTQAVLALERALAHGEPSPAALAAVQALLQREVAEPMLLIAMRGERAGMHQMLLTMRQGKVSLAQVVGPTGNLEKRLLDLSTPTLARRSHARFLRPMNEYVAGAQLPLEDQAPVMKQVEQKVRQAKVEYDVVTALLMPALLKVQSSHQRMLGDMHCAIVALAAERFRRDHGRWPETLGSLVGKYLTEIPKDPFDGKPLRYRRLADGVLIYCLGLDGTDEGGALNRRNANAKGSDRGFRLWDVPARRQPAAEMLTLPN